jgi:hypothetical protein
MKITVNVKLRNGKSIFEKKVICGEAKPLGPCLPGVPPQEIDTPKFWEGSNVEYYYMCMMIYYPKM